MSSPKKIAKRLKSVALKAQEQGNGRQRRPERFRCYDVMITYDFLSTGQWHMSVSQVLEPSDADREALAKLIEALGVPEDKREGTVRAHQYQGGKRLPDVRHFNWEMPEDMN
jgi:hypothetical protein